jgi:hypothetical protein
MHRKNLLLPFAVLDLIDLSMDIGHESPKLIIIAASRNLGASLSISDMCFSLHSITPQYDVKHCITKYNGYADMISAIRHEINSFAKQRIKEMSKGNIVYI